VNPTKLVLESGGMHRAMRSFYLCWRRHLNCNDGKVESRAGQRGI